METTTTPAQDRTEGAAHGNADADANRPHADLSTASPAYRAAYGRAWNWVPESN